MDKNHSDYKLRDMSKSPVLSNISAALVATTAFGVIDATCFLVAETTIEKQLHKIPGVDENMAELCTGGLSAAIAMMISAWLKGGVGNSHTTHVNSPLVDASGVILGTLIVLGVYYTIKQWSSKQSTTESVQKHDSEPEMLPQEVTKTA